MTQLAASGVHCRLGSKAVLQGITASFTPGQVTAVVGPNGAGKSTLLSCLAGLRTPDQGQVRLGDADLSLLPARTRAQRIAFLPQTPEIAWAVEARTLVGLGRTPYTGSYGLSSADLEAVDRALAVSGASALASRNVATLSGGERARVLIARALAGEPQWLLADEPLTGLDPGYQLDMATLLRKLAADGCGIVITLHDLHMALRIAHRILILADGRVLADGDPTQVLSPAVLAEAYGVQARFWPGEAGPQIEIVGRRG